MTNHDILYSILLLAIVQLWLKAAAQEYFPKISLSIKNFVRHCYNYRGNITFRFSMSNPVFTRVPVGCIPESVKDLSEVWTVSWGNDLLCLQRIEPAKITFVERDDTICLSLNRRIQDHRIIGDAAGNPLLGKMFCDGAIILCR